MAEVKAISQSLIIPNDRSLVLLVVVLDLWDDPTLGIVSAISAIDDLVHDHGFDEYGDAPGGFA
mgnify:CR=1 FL=1